MYVMALHPSAERRAGGAGVSAHLSLAALLLAEVVVEIRRQISNLLESGREP